MRVLILGGTRFVGKGIAETLLASGHTVTTLTRGKSPDELPGNIERLHGDRDQGTLGLQALKNRRWDACIDVSGYTPSQVRASAEILSTSVERYVFISAVSVYGDPQDRPVCETHPCLPPASEQLTEIDADTYGPLKVTCENIVRQIYSERCTLIRPQVVVGPRDDRARYQYWIQRSLQGGGNARPGRWLRPFAGH